MKPSLLFLAHRIPYPPNKGDKIRSFNFLKYLSSQFDIYLGTFIDDISDNKHILEMENYCKDYKIINIHPLFSKIKSLRGFLNGRALTIDYYTHNSMQNWVDDVIKQNSIEQVFVFSSAMSQYVEKHPSLNRVIDFIDIDSDKWTQYSNEKRWPMKWVYAREGRMLRRYENRIAREFDASCFVSRSEADHFRQGLTDGAEKIHYINNGVDHAYFSPFIDYKNPYQGDAKRLVFVGAMDYWPNIHAISWFLEVIFPRLQSGSFSIEVYIVGSNPTSQVKELQTIEGVTVTGRVEDVRPYLYYADLVLAPLRIARGVQNKVLEAMSMNKPILATKLALEGIDQAGQVPGFLPSEIDAMVDYINECISGQEQNINTHDFIQSNYDWDLSLSYLNQLLK